MSACLYGLILGAVFSAGMLVWGYTPNPHETREQLISPLELQLNESRRLIVDFPSRLRMGLGADTLQLKLEAGSATVEPINDIPNIDAAQAITAEARLDMAGIQIQPSGSIFTPLKRGSPATFIWSVTPRAAGIYRGTAWVYLIRENRLTGEKSRVPISAQIFEVRVTHPPESLYVMARALGGVGAWVSGGAALLFFFQNFRKQKTPEA